MTPLGYRGNSHWRDMSEYAVHFTKASGAASAYTVMMKILWEGEIIPGSSPLGAARKHTQLGTSQRSACFSEIPLDMLNRLIARRSDYGIGFRQDFLVANGGARVWYLDNDGLVAPYFRAYVDAQSVGGIEPSHPLWRLTPFVDFPGEYGAKKFRFEWEREWRVPGGLRFKPDDVAFLFIPEHLHPAARSFFKDHQREHTGPAYLCPYVDAANWDMTKIQNALAALP